MAVTVYYLRCVFVFVPMSVKRHCHHLVSYENYEIFPYINPQGTLELPT
jgi:hypothetical protein